MKSYIPECQSCGKQFDANEFLAGHNYNKNGTFSFGIARIGDKLYEKNMSKWERGNPGYLEQYKRVLLCGDCYDVYKEKSNEYFMDIFSKMERGKLSEKC
jgi:hypothetical protein